MLLSFHHRYLMAGLTATVIVLGGCGKEGEVNGSTGDETGQETGSSTASETNSDTGSDTSTDTEVTDLCTPDPCHGHGACEDSSGAVVCSCSGDYDPAGNCAACVSGKQDKDNNGSCLDTCTTAALTCSGHGTCSDTDGTAGCECTTGYMGDDCGECAGGYHLVGSDCVIDEDCGGNSCNDKGTCADTRGVVVCTCSGNYDPVGNCASCLAGYNNVGTSDCIAKCPSGTAHLLKSDLNRHNAPSIGRCKMRNRIRDPNPPAQRVSGNGFSDLVLFLAAYFLRRAGFATAHLPGPVLPGAGLIPEASVPPCALMEVTEIPRWFLARGLHCRRCAVPDGHHSVYFLAQPRWLWGLVAALLQNHPFLLPLAFRSDSKYEVLKRQLIGT
jgi:hypothetical protein